MACVRGGWASARSTTTNPHPRPHPHPHPRPGQVRKLMLKHERELRLGIRKILVQHGEGCDQPTPLEAPLYRRACSGSAVVGVGV